MKLITRDSDYAIRAVAFIASYKERIVPVTELVKDLKIPRPFLRKILQLLNKDGVLISHKGRGGGFELAIPPKNIYVIDIIEIFQGPFKLNECSLSKKMCPNIKMCLLKKRVDRIEEGVVAELKRITISSIL
ncbi:MAG: Rrf2 family transcriptional regulator [Candidatus Omnitrophica bacterium]|nr:Rrf2 family transcriptional regulator [Candidatus Omnitrophota bacterium]